ncbi:hypothetical protein CHUAL_011687 [Chamberlinius hualienensis]
MCSYNPVCLDLSHRLQHRMAGVQQCRQTSTKSSISVSTTCPKSIMTGLMATSDSRSPLSLVASPAESYNHKITGIPCVAAASRYTAPVHIDVGGTIYTSSLETLTKHPESKLAKMFNGSIPIVLDSLKQHYFIDRDGKMFRHILNFLRSNHLCLPDNFEELELLMEEAKFYDIPAMVKGLEILRRDRDRCGGGTTSAATSSTVTIDRNGHHNDNLRSSCHLSDDGSPDLVYQCLALNISPDLCERIMLSGERALVEESFPEISQALMDARSGVSWNTSDARHVIRFPLNGYCKLNSLQAIARLLNNGFKIIAASGGGVEGQQFSEYLFCRRAVPM